MADAKGEKRVEGKKAQGDFSKEQIIASAKYGRHRDLLDALLEEGKRYTAKEIDAVIEKFMKGEVK